MDGLGGEAILITCPSLNHKGGEGAGCSLAVVGSEGGQAMLDGQSHEAWKVFDSELFH